MKKTTSLHIVHLGLGAFSRSHLAWYTQHASDSGDWGIVAYTGRSRGLAETLTSQDGEYHLVERAAEGDRAQKITSILRAHPGDDVARLVQDIAAPETRIVSLTVTEAGYHCTASGSLDLEAADVRHDIDAIRRSDSARTSVPEVRTAVAKVALGLAARAALGSGDLTLLPCDNMPNNGNRVRRVLLDFERAAGLAVGEWIERHVSFISTSVDRITPRLDAEEQRHLGEEYQDNAVVVAEPFSDWVLSGDFPAGRPRWEDAGARFVADLTAWESRKLWLLNGAHTILASQGLLLGHQTVYEAITDPRCEESVSRFWDEAQIHLPPETEVSAYRDALIERFSNPSIEHRLAQIAQDTHIKAQVRLLPVAQLELAAGRSAGASAQAIALCIAAHRRCGVEWPSLDRAHNEAEATGQETGAELQLLLGRDLAATDFGRRVRACAQEMGAL